jgi:hypothetical protein
MLMVHKAIWAVYLTRHYREPARIDTPKPATTPLRLIESNVFQL